MPSETRFPTVTNPIRVNIETNACKLDDNDGINPNNHVGDGASVDCGVEDVASTGCVVVAVPVDRAHDVVPVGRVNDVASVERGVGNVTSFSHGVGDVAPVNRCDEDVAAPFHVVDSHNNDTTVSRSNISTHAHMPVFGVWKHKQLELTSTSLSFLTTASRCGNDGCFTLVKGVRGTITRPAIYTQTPLEQFWNGHETRPLVVGVRGPPEIQSFRQQTNVTLEELWSLRDHDYVNVAGVLGKRKRETEAALREKHFTVSKVPKCNMINKKNMKRCYRLEGEYLRAIPKPKDGEFYIGRSFPGRAKLYSEREIEFQAWRMFGGSVGFVRFLYRKYELWRTNTKRPRPRKDETFPIPNSYHDLFKVLWSIKKHGMPLDPGIEIVSTAVNVTCYL